MSEEPLERADPAVRALAREVRELRGIVEALKNTPQAPTSVDLGEIDKRLASLETRTRRHGETMSSISTGLQDLAGEQKAKAEQTTTPWWPDLEAEEAAERWKALGAWVTEVLPRSFGAGDAVRPCWYRHPEVVDLLTALRTAWNGAYKNPQAGASAALDWQDRLLPGAMTRCQAVFAQTSCTSRTHRHEDAHVFAATLGPDYEESMPSS